MWCKEKAKEAGATLLNIHAGANEVDTKKKKKFCTLHFSHQLMTQVCLRLAVCNKPTLRSIPYKTRLQWYSREMLHCYAFVI